MTIMTPPDERLPDRVTRWGNTWRIALALLAGGFLWLATFSVVIPDGPLTEPFRAIWLVFIDPIIGLIGASLLPWRRRWPVVIVTILTTMTAVSVVSVGPQTVSMVSLATRQRWREILPVTLYSVITAMVATRAVYPDTEPLPLWAETAIGLLFVVMVIAVGYSIGSRRALVKSWVDRAQTTEAEQQARVAQAQSAERTKIAREMHDVLAHRISLVTMHSGILSYREDLAEDERREAVAAIDSNARAALTDLREVLGVLREPDPGSPLRPQSTLADLPELLEEAREAGTRVTLTDHDLDFSSLPERVSRTAYRGIQEGLTNARKHAPGSSVDVTIDGRRGGELQVTISNPRSVRASAPPLPASGLGLLGLAERVELIGGRLEHGWLPEGRHRLALWLPWAK